VCATTRFGALCGFFEKAVCPLSLLGKFLAAALCIVLPCETQNSVNSNFTSAVPVAEAKTGKMGMGLSCLACTACTAACSTLSAVCSCAGCLCGGSSAKETPTDLMVGKLRSLALIITSLVIGLLTQYFWAKHAADHLHTWTSNCGNNETCIGNSAIYR
jgi:hypothetical protein